jgi:RNA polymerase sigma-70 factor, ECF subfamily
MVRDRDAAEDIVQDVFIKLWKNRENIDFSLPLKPYLNKATANTAISWLEKNKVSSSATEISDLKNDPEAPDNTESRLFEKELQAKIRQSLDKLPPKCKAIFILSRYEGMKYREIAEHLEISVKTVENQMCIALERLRKDLDSFLSSEYPDLKNLLPLLLVILFS